jgi:hypothetical protein
MVGRYEWMRCVFVSEHETIALIIRMRNSRSQKSKCESCYEYTSSSKNHMAQENVNNLGIILGKVLLGL